MSRVDAEGVTVTVIRVMLVDDESLVRTGLRLILEGEPDLVVVGEAEDGTTAIDLAQLLRPDVVLMDIRMKQMTGLEASRHILALDHTIKIVILTTFDYDEHVYEALRAGVSGFLLKDAPPEQLVSAVRIAARGEAMLEPSVARRVIADYATRGLQPRDSDDRLKTLTERELEVMRHVARGLTNAEIAAVLTISATTVKSHVSSILTKLQLRDRTQIAVRAYENGLMDSGR